jgi:hypothetical protein
MPQRLFPKGGNEPLFLMLLVAAPDVVDQKVQPTAFNLDAAEQRLNLGIHGVVAVHWDAPPTARGHGLGRFFNCAR